MNQLKPTDQVEVLYGDLESTHALLSSVYNYLFAQDLTTQYKSLRNTTTESALTKAVKKQRDRVFGLIHEAQQEAAHEAPDGD